MEKGLPFDAPEETGDVMRRQSENVPSMADYPYLVETAIELEKAGYDYEVEFLFGLDLILDAIERYKAGIDSAGAVPGFRVNAVLHDNRFLHVVLVWRITILMANSNGRAVHE